MKKIRIAVLGLVIFTGSAVFAQEQKKELKQTSEVDKEQRMEERMDKFAEELELTEKQKEQFIELRKTTYAERQKVKSDETLDEAGRKLAMKELRDEGEAKMAEILTEEQMLKFKAMQKEQHNMHKVEKRAVKKDPKMQKKTLELAPEEN